jgi:hypothetical protein
MLILVIYYIALFTYWLIIRLCTDPVEQEILYSAEWNMKQTDRDWEWGSSMYM